MSRAANVGIGVLLIVGSIVWLSFFGLVALVGAAFGADGIFWPAVFVIAIAAGAGSLGAGFYTAFGVPSARWSLILFGGLWATLWAFEVPYLDSRRSAGDWVLTLGNLVVAVAAISAGVWFRQVRRVRRSRELPSSGHLRG